MSKHEKEPSSSGGSDGGGGFWFKTLLIIIIVAWVALALGNLFGHYIVKSRFFNKKAEVQTAPTPEIVIATPTFEAPAGYGKEESGAKEVVGVKEEEKEEQKEETVKIDENAYKLQAGFFSDKDNAQKAADRIKSLGFAAYVEESKADGKTGYKVFAGGYKTREEAEKNKETLRAKGMEVMIVTP